MEAGHYSSSKDGGCHGNSDIKTEGGAKEEDSDETPPLSPHPFLSDRDRGEEVGVPALSGSRHPVTKASTPLRRTRVNTRMAVRRKGNCKASVSCENGISQACVHSTASEVSLVPPLDLV